MLTVRASKEAEVKTWVRLTRSPLPTAGTGVRDIQGAQMAMWSRETGEVVERTLKHEAETMPEFFAYSA